MSDMRMWCASCMATTEHDIESVEVQERPAMSLAPLFDLFAPKPAQERAVKVVTTATCYVCGTKRD